MTEMVSGSVTARQGKSVGRILLGWAMAFMLPATLWVAAVAYLWREGRNFVAIFADFGTELPSLTQAFTILLRPPWILLLLAAGLALLLVFAAIGALWQQRRGRSLKTPYLAFSLIGIIIIFNIAVLVLWHPLHTLMTSAATD